MKNSEINNFLINLKNDTVFDLFINKASFLLFLHGYKTITLEYINIQYYYQVKSFFNNYNHLFSYKISKLDNKEFIIIFSKDVDLLSEFKKIFDEYLNGKNENILEIGNLLGFPGCCVESFYNFFKNYTFNEIPDYMYNYFKVILGNSNIIDKRLDIFSNRLITHTPCSFSCQKSLNTYNLSVKILNLYGFVDLILDIGTNYIFFKNNNYIKIDNNLLNKSYGVYYGKNKYSDIFFRKIIHKIDKKEILNYENIPNTLYIKFH
ncbi:MAG: hypothetical protein QM490_02310 [Candidatus Gracilibacteria bacterium]